MADKALRGNKLTKQRRMAQAGPKSGSKRDTRSDSDDAWRESLSPGEVLGLSVSGGIKGKPHSTKEGREAAGAHHLKRFWDQFKIKKKSLIYFIFLKKFIITQFL